ncbi:MAG: hypothetical protein JWP33_631 [Blastococcus sp.]|nr:hypothetical protein [Blastococcus sp.]
MDIPVTDAAPWLVLGIALGIALVVLVGLGVTAARRRRSILPRPTGPGELAPAGAPLPAGAYVEDDLPGFLEFPPGFSSGTAPRQDGWPALSAAVPFPSGATSPTAAPSAAGAEKSSAGVLVAMSLATLLLVAAAAAVAVSRSPGSARPAAAGAGDGTPAAPREDGPSAATPSPGAAGAGDLADSSVLPGNDGAEARLRFGGVVLERHAVGVTAAYPVVGVTWDGDRALAHVELPTFNCLRDEAPDDPIAAGCMRSVPEYADLAAGDLEVHRDGDRLIVRGAFPTYLRPNGTPPAWTGRRYELVITAEPERRGAGWQPARGEVELGTDRAATSGAKENRIRFGG